MTTKCEEFDKHVGRRLALARTRAGFPAVTPAAERLGLSRQLLKKYEDAELRTPAFVLQQAATLYDVSVLFFYARFDRASTRDHRIVKLIRSMRSDERRRLARRADHLGDD